MNTSDAAVHDAFAKRAATSREVATFWHGPPLACLDLACLQSFRAAGFHVTVYSYEPVVGLPADVASADAQDIVDRGFLSGFVFSGKPSLSHFSDLFRYRLFAATEAAWIDMDLLCLAPFALSERGDFFARETARGMSSSILRIDRTSPELSTLIEAAERMGREGGFPWGATGPALLTSTLSGKALATACAPSVFFPVPWDDWWKPFLPSAREECDALCSEASAIHLWNNIVERSGYWKDLAPPAGSFLHAALARLDLLDLFRDVCPASVMEHIAHNYRDSRTADHMPVGRLVRIAVPRLIGAVRRRLRPSS